MPIESTTVQEKIVLVSSKMKNIKNQNMQEQCRIGIIDIQNWEWAQGVGIYGLYRYFEKCGDQSELDWIVNWVDNNIRKGLPARNVNTTAPMYTVAHLAQRLHNQQYYMLCADWAEWVMKKLPKTKYNGFQHVVSDGDNNMQLWDDTLFMTVLFLAKMGMMQGNQAYLTECEHQFLLHMQYLQDTKSGLWYHGWTFDGNHNFAKALWGRGNCWVTAFIPDYIEMTGIDNSVRQIMTDALNAQAEALVKYQNGDGTWNTLIDDPHSYLEISATAGFAYGILKAIRIHILDDTYRNMAMRAAEAVMSNIDKDGTVLNVSCWYAAYCCWAADIECGEFFNGRIVDLY